MDFSTYSKLKLDMPFQEKKDPHNKFGSGNTNINETLCVESANQTKEKKDAAARFACNNCGIEKHMTEYSAIFCKQYLREEYRELNYRCMECQFPKCDRCDARPEKPVSANHLDAKGRWLCPYHRYPPCSGCGAPKPLSMQGGNNKFSQWTCENCKKGSKENKCLVHPAEKGSDQDLREEQRKQLDQMTDKGKKNKLDDLDCSECKKTFPRKKCSQILVEISKIIDRQKDNLDSSDSNVLFRHATPVSVHGQKRKKRCRSTSIQNKYHIKAMV